MFSYVLVLIALLYVESTLSNHDMEYGEFERDPTIPLKQLDENVRPVVYKIDLRVPSLSSDYFEGRVEIIFAIFGNKTYNSIYLNSYLDVLEIELNSEDAFFHENKNEHALIVGKNAKPGINKLVITYKGAINSKTRIGLFTDDMGKSYKVISHPWGAHHLYPCFDDPTFKAAFEISIDFAETIFSNAGLDTFGYSNTNFKRKNGSFFSFGRTQLMSPSSVQLFIGSWKAYSVEKIQSQNIEVIGQKSVFKFPQFFTRDIIQNSLTKMNDLTEVDYRTYMSDLNFIGSPSRERYIQASPALILCSEELLFKFSNIYTTEFDVKQAQINALATLWFEHIVTPTNRDHRWLSVGLAQYWSNHFLFKYLSEARADEVFLVETISYALDANYKSKISLSENCVTLGCYEPKFKRAYSAKAAALINYLFYDLRVDFSQKIGGFFLKFQQEPYETKDFFDFFGADEYEVFFTENNYPILSLHRIESGRVEIRQLSLKENGLPWTITIRYSEGNDRPARVQKITEVYTTVYQEKNLPFIANADGAGYYRVQYDNFLVNEIRKYAHYDRLDWKTRAAFVRDASFFAKHRKISIKSYFQALSFLTYDAKYAVWKLGSSFYRYIAHMTMCTAHWRRKIKSHTKTLLHSIRPFVFFQNSGKIDYVESKRDDLIMYFRCVILDECNEDSKDAVKNFYEDPIQEGEKTQWFFCAAGKSRDKFLYDQAYLTVVTRRGNIEQIRNSWTLISCANDFEGLKSILENVDMAKDEILPDIVPQFHCRGFDAIFDRFQLEPSTISNTSLKWFHLLSTHISTDGDEAKLVALFNRNKNRFTQIGAYSSFDLFKDYNETKAKIEERKYIIKELHAVAWY